MPDSSLDKQRDALAQCRLWIEQEEGRSLEAIVHVDNACRNQFGKPGFNEQFVAMCKAIIEAQSVALSHGGEDMALGWNAGVEQAAKVCEEWGDAKVQKWSGSELEDYAKGRAWDALQCAAAIRKEKLPLDANALPSSNGAVSPEALRYAQSYIDAENHDQLNPHLIDIRISAMARELVRLAESATARESQCCCGGFITATGYCPVHMPNGSESRDG